MSRVIIELSRFLMRDFRQDERAAFVRYQMDPRYLDLYDLPHTDAARAEQLFERFMEWQREEPRRNFQLGIFSRATGDLLGCAGLRIAHEGVAVLGIELAPEQWGRFRLAADTATALVEYGFRTLKLETIIGNTASGNGRVEKLARWLGAEIVARRTGPEWMRARGWQEVEWALRQARWEASQARKAAVD